MASDLSIVRTSDFLRYTGDGKADIETGKRILSSIAKTCIDRQIDFVLIDIRDANTKLSLTDIHTLARAFPETGFRKQHRVAILHRYRAGEKAEFFAICAAEGGWNVRAFETYEDAMEWFSNKVELT